MKSIKEVRQEKGITVEQLASTIGTRPQTIRSWEDGKSIPSTSHTRALYAALGVGVDDVSFLPQQARQIPAWVNELASILAATT